MKVARLNKLKGPLLVLGLGLSLIFSGCKKNDDSTPIVLPPGTGVQYTTEDFYSVSGEFFDVELNQYDPAKKTLTMISDLTPDRRLNTAQGILYTLPKDKNTTASVFLIKVNLARHPLNFEAIVLPTRMTRPSLVTTLAVELLRQYPHRGLESYREETIIAIEEFIKKFTNDQLVRYPKVKRESLDKIFKFMKNGLSSNKEFLKLLSDYDVNFSFNSNGVVTDAPFPFGSKNNMPVLDVANSTPMNKAILGIEKMETIIRGKATDMDGDILVYAWKLEGKNFETKTDTQFEWTTDYDGYRPAPYKVTLQVTDGGKPLDLTWDVLISNFNRKPSVTSNCLKEITENVETRCRITAVDHDNEKTNFIISDRGVSARATFNGLTTDNTTRSLTINNASSVELVFRPNNTDALTRSAYFQIDVEDESGGVTTVPIAFAVEDINSPPDIVGTYQQIIPNTDHEWDYCARENPDGGFATFQFYVTVKDPDNETATVDGGYDVVSEPRLSGSLACVGDGCANPIACPAALMATQTPTAQYFCFEWKASHEKKKGLLGFTFKDNHGGNSELREIELTAQDRNERPCVGAIPSATTSTLSLNLRQQTYPIRADDNDRESPFISVTSNQNTNPSDVFPFLIDSNTGNNLIFRRKTGGNTLNRAFFRTQTADFNVVGGSKFDLRVNFESAHSGVVKFYRPTGYTADIVIPKDFILETNPALFPNFRYKYKTSVAVTIEKDDVEVWIPVTVYDQSVVAGALNRVRPQTINGNSFSSTGLTISNAATVNEFGAVTITRSDASSALVLPKYLEFYSSNEGSAGVSTVRYYNYNRVEFAAGQASATVNVAQLKNYVKQSVGMSNSLAVVTTFIPFLEFNVSSAVATPQNEMIFSGALADSTLRVAYENLYNYKDFSLYPMNSAVPRSLMVTAEDGYTLPSGSVITDQNANQYRVLADLTLYGTVPIQRLGSASSPLSSALTLAAGITEFRSSNGSRYALESDLNFGANTTTVTTFLKRTRHTNPTVDSTGNNVGLITFQFSDKNFRPVFISPIGALNLTVTEGQNVNDFLLEVNDNPSNPGSPNDPFDRHYFTFALQGAIAPNGQVAFCREKGDSLSNITAPSCTPCNTVIANDYWDSARCYVRFFPSQTHDAATDIDQSYTYVVRASDDSTLSTGEAHENAQILTLKVREINDPPIFTDSTWAPLSSSAASPYTCGGTSCGDFLEGSDLDFTIYASDSDRNSSNKALTFSLGTQVFDLQTNQWITRPAGINVVTDSVVSNNVYGGNWGSRYRGRVRWKPTDAEAKALAGTGFIIPVNVRDSAVAPDTPLSATAYFKVSVKNVNNPPNLKSPVTLTLTTDLYYKNTTSIVLTDSDSANIGSPFNFSTSLSLCKSESVFDCAAPRDGWPDEIKTYDTGYTRNSAVAQCRSGGAVNPTFALPYLTRLAASTVSGLRQYAYQFEWCPQRGHIGTYFAYLQLNDNGDKDRNGLSHSSLKVVSPLKLVVQAPVHFTSPKKNESNVVVNAANQAFVNKQYIYQTLIRNSKVSNVRFQLLSAPTGMTLDNNSTLKNDNSAAIGVRLLWTPTNTHLTTGSPIGWHTVSLRVLDTTNNVDSDTVTFQIQVKDPLNPVQVRPVITKFPNVNDVKVDEKTNNIFTVSATDSNNDRLFYSWYVDGVKKFDEGPSFNYFPTLNDFGRHTIRVDVYDGFYTDVMATWNVEVRNTVPNIIDTSKPDFNLTTFNQTYLGKTITNHIWATETKVETVSGVDSFNSILFSGSYTKGQHMDFVYNFKLKNGNLNPGLSTSNPLLAESLPWVPGNDTSRISFKQGSGTSFTIILTPLDSRNGAFTSGLTNAVCIPQNLGITSAGFNAGHLCSSSADAGLLYKNKNSYGNLVAAVYERSGIKFDITVTKDFRTLEWMDSGYSVPFYNNEAITDCGAAGCGNGMRFYGVATSTRTNRIYVTARDISNSINKLLVFDASPLLTGSNPVLLSTLNISDGVNPDNKVTEVLVVNDSVNGSNNINKVYMLLAGTGGVAILPDESIIPNSGDITFVGNTGQMGQSAGDIQATGARFVYNSGSKLVYGIIKDSNQVFSLDVFNDNIQVQPITVQGGLDAILTFSNDRSTFGISRTLGQIFKIQ